jgi:hypothetical protein
MPKRYSRQQIAKFTKKKCFFCGEDDHAVLQAHRIISGENGGKYHDANILVSCANCHCKIHDGQITVDCRKYKSSSAKMFIHYWDNGEEFWRAEE